MSLTSGAIAASRAWVITRRRSDGMPLANTVPSSVSMIAASGEFLSCGRGADGGNGAGPGLDRLFERAGRSSHAIR